MKINNCRELWATWMSEPSWVNKETEERSQQLLQKWVLKGTECGCIFGTTVTGIYVSGYAEGSDAELPTYRLKWGFTIDEWDAALDLADKDGVEEYDRANDQDLARLVDEKEEEIDSIYGDLGGEG